MITVGTLMAIVNGTVNPLMCVVFGQMTDSFIQDARLSNNHNISHPSECSSAGGDGAPVEHHNHSPLVFHSRGKQHLRRRYAEVGFHAQ